MLQKVEKIGNDLTVKIPASFAERCGLDSGCQVNVRLKNDRIVIESADQSFSTFTAVWNEEERHSEMYYG